MRHWNKICLRARVHVSSVPSAGMGCDQPGHEAHRPVPIPGSTSQKMNIQNRVHFSFFFFHSGLLNRNVVYYRHGRERRLLGLVTKSNFLHVRHSEHLRTSMNQVVNKISDRSSNSIPDWVRKNGTNMKAISPNYKHSLQIHLSRYTHQHTHI